MGGAVGKPHHGASSERFLVRTLPARGAGRDPAWAGVCSVPSLRLSCLPDMWEVGLSERPDRSQGHHVSYMSVESIAKALREPQSEPGEVIASQLLHRSGEDDTLSIRTPLDGT